MHISSSVSLPFFPAQPFLPPLDIPQDDTNDEVQIYYNNCPYPCVLNRTMGCFTIKDIPDPCLFSFDYCVRPVESYPYRKRIQLGEKILFNPHQDHQSLMITFEDHSEMEVMCSKKQEGYEVKIQWKKFLGKVCDQHSFQEIFKALDRSFEIWINTEDSLWQKYKHANLEQFLEPLYSDLESTVNQGHFIKILNYFFNHPSFSQDRAHQKLIGLLLGQRRWKIQEEAMLDYPNETQSVLRVFPFLYFMLFKVSKFSNLDLSKICLQYIIQYCNAIEDDKMPYSLFGKILLGPYDSEGHQCVLDILMQENLLNIDLIMDFPDDLFKMLCLNSQMLFNAFHYPRQRPHRMRFLERVITVCPNDFTKNDKSILTQILMRRNVYDETLLQIVFKEEINANYNPQNSINEVFSFYSKHLSDSKIRQLCVHVSKITQESLKSYILKSRGRYQPLCKKLFANFLSQYQYHENWMQEMQVNNELTPLPMVRSNLFISYDETYFESLFTAVYSSNGTRETLFSTLLMKYKTIMWNINHRQGPVKILKKQEEDMRCFLFAVINSLDVGISVLDQKATQIRDQKMHLLKMEFSNNIHLLFDPDFKPLISQLFGYLSDHDVSMFLMQYAEMQGVNFFSDQKKQYFISLFDFCITGYVENKMHNDYDYVDFYDVQELKEKCKLYTRGEVILRRYEDAWKLRDSEELMSWQEDWSFLEDLSEQSSTFLILLQQLEQELMYKNSERLKLPFMQGSRLNFNLGVVNYQPGYYESAFRELFHVDRIFHSVQLNETIEGTEILIECSKNYRLLYDDEKLNILLKCINKLDSNQSFLYNAVKELQQRFLKTTRLFKSAILNNMPYILKPCFQSVLHQMLSYLSDTDVVDIWKAEEQMLLKSPLKLLHSNEQDEKSENFSFQPQIQQGRVYQVVSQLEQGPAIVQLYNEKAQAELSMPSAALLKVANQEKPWPLGNVFNSEEDLPNADPNDDPALDTVDID